MYLVKTPIFIQKIYSSLTWKIDSKDSIYLTFDDGPDPEVTPWVLDLLKSYNAKATFFCIGENAERYPELINQIISEGHSTGNHTYSHLSGWTSKTEKYLNDVKKCRMIVDSNLFRPPYGRLKPKQLKNLYEDYKIIMWDIMCGDFEEQLSNEKCLSNIIDNASPGSIILMHDSKQSFTKLKYILPKVLDFFKGKSLKLAAIHDSIR